MYRFLFTDLKNLYTPLFDIPQTTENAAFVCIEYSIHRNLPMIINNILDGKHLFPTLFHIRKQTLIPINRQNKAPHPHDRVWSIFSSCISQELIQEPFKTTEKITGG